MKRMLRGVFCVMLALTAVFATACGDDEGRGGGPIEELSMSKSSITLSADGTHQLSVVTKPADADQRYIVWQSTAPAVATVSDKGLVTAVSDGGAVIIASTPDGKFVAVCNVLVEI